MSESDGPTRENSVASKTFSAQEQVLHPSAFQSFTHTIITQRLNSALSSLRERKNKPPEHVVIGGISGLRLGSKGQLEVDKNIWDLTKGVHVEEQQVSTAQRAWEALYQDVKTLVTTMRQDPLLAFIPLLLLLLMLGGGLWAVFASAAKETKNRQEIAQRVVRDKGLYLQTELAKAFLPAYVCSVYVRRDPSWPTVNRTFAPMALEMIRLSNAGSVITLSLIPNGIIYTMVPLAGKDPDDDVNWKAIGKDWLQDKFNQDKVHKAISTRNLTIIGPYNLTQGGIGMVAMLTINIAQASRDDLFDIPPMNYSTLPWQKSNRIQDGPNVTDTPFALYMYNNVTKTKWWGLTTVLISWDILREEVIRLEELELEGYDYVLARPVANKELSKAQRFDLLNASTHELAVAWSDAVQLVPATATNNGAPPKVPGEARPLVYYDLHERLAEPMSYVILVEGASLTLYISLKGGWCPGWKWPLVAGTAVLSVLLSVLLFLVLVNRRQHMRLLHAMIPKKVVSMLRRGKIFTESFEVVTVLFSDIVAYTTMSAHMTPIEIVQMLDELYKEFDNLAEKHRLYKLDTIGDAMMLVGGAPTAEDSTAAAARVAQMALDMIRVTSTKVLAGGHIVKIRVGIHSGPAVAAVVGHKAPKYTLFGDTVNTASRMESNGSPMRVHISGATAELLAQAGGFIVESRGEIPIKGKGAMSTYWVTGTQAWLKGPCPRDEAIDITHLTSPTSGSNMIVENTGGECSAASPVLPSSAAATGSAPTVVTAGGHEGLPSPAAVRARTKGLSRHMSYLKPSSPSLLLSTFMDGPDNGTTLESNPSKPTAANYSPLNTASRDLTGSHRGPQLSLSHCPGRSESSCIAMDSNLATVPQPQLDANSDLLSGDAVKAGNSAPLVPSGYAGAAAVAVADDELRASSQLPK